MIENVSGDQDQGPLMQSLSAIESIVETYLEEIKKSHSACTQEVFEKAQALLLKTIEQSRRVMNMIQHFQSPDTARTEEGLPQNRGLVYDAVYQVLRAMQYEFPMEKITILKILPRGLAEPGLPPGHLETILFQLLYNARQSLGDIAGIITVEAAEKITPSSENSHPGRFLLRVSDTGPSIPEEFLANLHDPFFTVEHPCRVNGVGLSVVQRLVNDRRGLMRIETCLTGNSYIVEFAR